METLGLDPCWRRPAVERRCCGAWLRIVPAPHAGHLPGLDSTQTPGRLQTFTNPSNAITFHRAGCCRRPQKNSVPTTPAPPAGGAHSNLPSGLAIFCACVRSFPVSQLHSVCCAPASCLTTFMDDSEPTFAPTVGPARCASRVHGAYSPNLANRQRSSRSSKCFPASTFMLTAGITREMSPARCPAAWERQMSAGIAIERKQYCSRWGTRLRLHQGLSWFTACIYCSTGGRRICHAKRGTFWPTLYIPCGTSR